MLSIANLFFLIKKFKVLPFLELFQLLCPFWAGILSYHSQIKLSITNFFSIEKFKVLTFNLTIANLHDAKDYLDEHASEIADDEEASC